MAVSGTRNFRQPSRIKSHQCLPGSQLSALASFRPSELRPSPASARPRCLICPAPRSVRGSYKDLFEAPQSEFHKHFPSPNARVANLECTCVNHHTFSMWFVVLMCMLLQFSKTCDELLGIQPLQFELTVLTALFRMADSLLPRVLLTNLKWPTGASRNGHFGPCQHGTVGRVDIESFRPQRRGCARQLRRVWPLQRLSLDWMIAVYH